MSIETATFAAGCFWGVESSFRKIDGIVDAIVGYTGGTTADPTYEQVCTGRTGHAEAVQLRYDTEKVSYSELLNAFWDMHDPTTRDRQGPDVGSQYRSAIFYHTPEQEREARASLERLQQGGRHGGEIVTQIEPASTFYRAEDYHQQYFDKKRGFFPFRCS